MHKLSVVRNSSGAHQDSACQACGFSGMCLPAGLDPGGAIRFSELSQHRLRLQDAQAPLYWAGEAFENLYAVREGCIKTFTVDDQGNEHVRGFHLPGDIVGLDAIHARHYPASAAAVTPSEVCVIPYANLARLVTDVPALQHRMLEMLSQDLSVSLALAGDYSAEQRLAAFILYLQQRMLDRGLANGQTLRLGMPRRDIASYLRLAMETVSRVLGRFEREDWIEVSGRDLRINDAAALWQLAAPVGIGAVPVVSRRPPQPVRHLGRIAYA